MAISYPESTIFHSEDRVMTSSITGQNFQISVWLPPEYSNSSKSYPVLYLLDGNFLFGVAANLILPLIWGNELPELIIIGIGYKIQSYDEWGSLRSHDMTPTAIRDVPGSGGAENFLNFIKKDLIPYIDTNYKTNKTDRTILGHSFGGLFVLYALLHEPGLFRRYCAGSPVPDYDNRVLFAYENNYAAQHPALPATVVIIVGELENDAIEVTKDFCTILNKRNYNGFELTFMVLEGESHVSLLAPLIVKGLKTIFA